MQTNLAMQVTTAPAAPTGTQARAQPTPPDVTAATDPSHFSTIALSTFNAADTVMYAAYSDAEDACSMCFLFFVYWSTFTRRRPLCPWSNSCLGVDDVWFSLDGLGDVSSSDVGTLLVAEIVASYLA